MICKRVYRLSPADETSALDVLNGIGLRTRPVAIFLD